jgi:hypothetical protein
VVKFFSSKRRILVAGVAILLLLFLLRPGASRLKSRIITSISSGVGRSVDIGSVHLRVLPRPGFDLENLVVYDDPAFGAEPMLRASEVAASLRLTSLLRGRIEIARLDLTEPSLNLVHGENGRWNLEALVERTAHTPLAPTSKAKLEPRPGFPYIEATSARINFKNGPEKKPFALTNADFSLWQDSENAWGVRLKTQPVRTDLNVNDTGVLQLTGKWQRAATLRETPLQFSIEWKRAQLGQITKLLTGSDQGWRGGIQIQATLAGTPGHLAVSGDAAMQDFRRYDITSGEPLRLAAHCDGEYSSLDHAFHGVACNAPVSNGLIALKGDTGLPGSHSHKLVLMARNVPASTLVALAQRAKKNLPEDLIAAGMLRGNVTIDETPGSALQIEGQGEIADFQLSSAANKAEIGPELVPFVFISRDSREPQKTHGHTKFPAPPVSEGPHLEFGPFPVAMERVATEHATSATVRGWMDRSGYRIALTGEAEIAHALRVTRMLGVPTINAVAEGSSQLDLQIAGSWPGWSDGTHTTFPALQATGTAKLRNVRVIVRGIAEPVEIASADLQLGPEESKIEKLNAIAAGTSWNGSLEVPRGCGTPTACVIHFNVKADRIALNELSEWASPAPKQEPWYRVLDSKAQPRPSLLASLQASGQLAVDHLQISTITANHVSANVKLDRGQIQISGLQADFLGGTHRGDWQADFSVKPAVCKGSGSLNGFQLARLTAARTEETISGMASVSYQASGPCGAASQAFLWSSFWNSAAGTLQFALNNAVLPGFSLQQDEGALKFANLSGQARLQEGMIEVKDAKLDSASGNFLLSGTASLQRELKLKLSRSTNGSSGGYSITGTLAEPKIALLPGAEQARLKSDPAK